MEISLERLHNLRNKIVHGIPLTASESEWLSSIACFLKEALNKEYQNGTAEKDLLPLAKMLATVEVYRSLDVLKPKHALERIMLCSYLLPPRLRRELFEPAFNDIKGDFLKARRRFTSKGERRWLTFCFGLHTSILVVQCFWAMLSDRTKRIILKFVPEAIRRWLAGPS